MDSTIKTILLNPIGLLAIITIETKNYTFTKWFVGEAP